MLSSSQSGQLTPSWRHQAFMFPVSSQMWPLPLVLLPAHHSPGKHLHFFSPWLRHIASSWKCLFTTLAYLQIGFIFILPCSSTCLHHPWKTSIIEFRRVDALLYNSKLTPSTSFSVSPLTLMDRTCLNHIWVPRPLYVTWLRAGTQCMLAKLMGEQDGMWEIGLRRL